MCDNRCGCLERLAAAASQHPQVRTSTTDALAREGGQMPPGKKLVQSMFARRGYRIVRLHSDAQYRPTAADARHSASLLHEIHALVQPNPLHDAWHNTPFLATSFEHRRIANTPL